MVRTYWRILQALDAAKWALLYYHMPTVDLSKHDHVASTPRPIVTKFKTVDLVHVVSVHDWLKTRSESTLDCRTFYCEVVSLFLKVQK